MYNHLFSQPIQYEIKPNQSLLVSLADDVSDFVLLPALSQPLAEIIISELPSHTNEQGASIILTCQPFFTVSHVESLNDKDTHDQEILDKEQLDQGKVNKASEATASAGYSLNSVPDTSPKSDTISHQCDVSKHLGKVTRALGQGCRLYARVGIAPRISAAMLRKGVRLTFSFIHSDEGVVIEYEQSVCEAITLEKDLRLNQEPKELIMAKAILARNFDYEEPPATIALNISEIEQVRADISHYLSEERNKVHAIIAAQLLKLDNLLNHKQQWLLRTYSQSQQRTNYASAANELSKDVEDLQRKLECFALLAPADVSLMVDKLTEDN
ncbi:hypothetical protein AN944_00848 [Shewanella sp. P1-14-1]|uniref:hypothetical protein n=1 Tax=Shewanella sp. P1-14-1 TaxID=1723761 RepID=UPI0006D674FC|nr:hypothetical protein [Shewanella sp. P1-14-1]KPZ72606.1 hypothetical protein AN944_00848 [Shewanella sp. P1-14-1]